MSGRLDAFIEGDFDDSEDNLDCGCKCDFCTGKTPSNKASHCMKAECSYSEWVGMPEFAQDNKEPFRQIIVSFEKEDDVKELGKKIEQLIPPKTKSLWFPAKIKNNSISMWIDDQSEHL